MNFLEQFLFPDNYGQERKMLRSSGFSKPTSAGLGGSINQMRYQDRQDSLASSSAALGQLAKYIVMMRGGLQYQNGGAPGYAPAYSKTAAKNLSGPNQMDPLTRALMQLQTSDPYTPRGYR